MDISNEPGVSGMVQGPPTPAVSAEIAKRSTFVGPPAPTAPTGYAGPTAPRINRLTGLPFGYQPGDKLPDGASPAMQSAAAGSARNMEAADQAPRATDAEAAAVTRMMERDGAIPTKPGPTYAGPRPSKPMGTVRKDGYKPRSDAEDRQREQESATARETGTMGTYFTKQGQPEMAKAFKDRVTPEQQKSMSEFTGSAPRAMRVLTPEQFAAESSPPAAPAAPRTGFALARRR